MKTLDNIIDYLSTTENDQLKHKGRFLNFHNTTAHDAPNYGAPHLGVIQRAKHGGTAPGGHRTRTGAQERRN